MNQAFLWHVKNVVDCSNNFLFQLLCTCRELLQQLAAIFKQLQETDLSVSAGECALQSSKLHIWVTYCIELSKCVQLSQKLDSYQNVCVCFNKSPPTAGGKYSWGGGAINYHTLSYSLPLVRQP